MNKSYCSLGLMSGTSSDGVDASIIKSDGKDEYNVISDNYFSYTKEITQNIHNLREKIYKLQDLINYSKEIVKLENDITIFHANVVEELSKNHTENIDFIGFHGHTIFHNSLAKKTKQLGDGVLLSKITKKKVVFNFRENDLNNGGEGAPLAPIFHKLLIKKNNIRVPAAILNIGGIANITSIKKNLEMFSMDIGPGNCLIDKWIRLNTDKNFDENGNLARSGKIDKFILEQSLDSFYNNNISTKKSFDINDFDLFFLRGLNLENGAATITEFTAEILSKKILDDNIYVCGGGRKNKFLIELIEKKIKNRVKLIDIFKIDGDFIESQAFAYLAIRSYLKLPISFPQTTGCKIPCSGGDIVKNF
tara:strand:+ start:206 stop:1294 length:1089 start_codon:yes stop_codon:yes gene_type:complete